MKASDRRTAAGIALGVSWVMSAIPIGLWSVLDQFPQHSGGIFVSFVFLTVGLVVLSAGAATVLLTGPDDPLPHPVRFWAIVALQTAVFALTALDAFGGYPFSIRPASPFAIVFLLIIWALGVATAIVAVRDTVPPPPVQNQPPAAAEVTSHASHAH